MHRVAPLVVGLLVISACERESAPPPPITAPPASAISVLGFGTLRIGMTLAEATSATGGELTAPPATAAAPCVYATFPGAPRGVAVMVQSDTLVRIEVREAGVATADGLQVGASTARADSLYGASALRRPHKYGEGEYLIVRPLAPTDSIHRLVIEMLNGRVTTYRVGRFPEVEYVEGCA